MLLGHSTFSETTFANPRLDVIHNLAFGVTQDALGFTIGTETVTAGSNVTLTDTDLQLVISLKFNQIPFFLDLKSHYLLLFLIINLA